MLWDTHMHTHFSGDSNADPAAMARSAIEKNLAGICITDHLDYDYPDEPDLFTIDFPQYEKGIRQRYSPQIASRLGGEYYTLVFVGDDIRKIRQRRI